MTIEEAAAFTHYGKPYAWVMQGARRLKEPIPYRHPSGAVKWVSLGIEVQRAIREQLNDSV